MKLNRYSVTGSGLFPFDMLRYDQAWPNSINAVMAIEAEGKRTVELSGLVAPTVDRWRSFRWSVSNIDMK